MFKNTALIKNKIRKANAPVNYTILAFFVIFTVGVIIGCATVKKGDSPLLHTLSVYLNDTLAYASNGGFWVCLKNSVCASVMLPLLAFFCGLCAFGAPLCVILPLFSGAVCGLTAATYYALYSSRGLGFCALAVFPYFAIIIATLFLCCCESLGLSSDIFTFVTGNDRTKKNKPDLKNFCLRYLILCIPLLVASLIRAVGFELFSGLFGLD